MSDDIPVTSGPVEIGQNGYSRESVHLFNYTDLETMDRYLQGAEADQMVAQLQLDWHKPG